MNPRRNPEAVFLDTAYVYALVNTRDAWHQTAVRWQQRLARDGTRLITTEFILIEIADGLANVRFRREAQRIIATLRASPLVEVIPASSQLFGAAFNLYGNRADKEWGLTDCASFVTMTERELHSPLTADHHFQQAGFRALLLESESREIQP